MICQLILIRMAVIEKDVRTSVVEDVGGNGQGTAGVQSHLAVSQMAKPTVPMLPRQLCF